MNRYHEVKDRGAVLPLGCSSPKGSFIQRAAAALKKTEVQEEEKIPVTAENTSPDFPPGMMNPMQFF